MKTLNGVLLFALVGIALAQRQRPKPKIPEVDAQCMNCICQASSNCDVTLKCHNAGGDSYFCGPYVVSWAYWHDGGRPGDKGKAHDFETCLTNRTCAEEAVRGYMRKYGQDCDGSGAIDCYDFARIHKLGFENCGGDAIYDTDYWEKLEACYPYAYPDTNNYNNNGSPIDSVNANNGFQPVPDYNSNGSPIENINSGFQPVPDYEYGEGNINARRVE